MLEDGWRKMLLDPSPPISDSHCEFVRGRPDSRASRPPAVPLHMINGDPLLLRDTLSGLLTINDVSLVDIASCGVFCLWLPSGVVHRLRLCQQGPYV